MTELPCPRCGHGNHVNANFCPSCGYAMSSGVDETMAHPVLNPGGNTHEATLPLAVHGGAQDTETGVLIVTRGPNVGARIPLHRGSTTLGRHPESVIFLDDITVSRRHAEISTQGARYQIRDAGSLNGTYVNRQRVDDAWLVTGDEVQVGKFKLVFVTTELGATEHVAGREVS